jgi:pimeloyl-ACP methyl ester carboxylesterase
VLDALELGRVVLVGHDAGGPDAIDYALDQPGRVERATLFLAEVSEAKKRHAAAPPAGQAPRRR